MNEIRLKAYAKINLSLYVTGKRPDGYHDIVSVMQDIDLYDDVEASLTGDGKIEVIMDTDLVPSDKTNLAYRGGAAVLEGIDTGCGARIAIGKNLPVAAGIAGGSGNAASAMLAVNAQLGYPYSLRELMAKGARVGADVPFSIMMNAYRNSGSLAELSGLSEASPAALMKGIGDIVEPVRPVKSHVILMNPGVGVSTAEAYRAIDEKLSEKNHDSDFPLYYNVFEEYTYKSCPEARRLKDAMDQNLNADHIVLSGSGPTIAAYYENEALAKSDYSLARRSGWIDENWKIWYTLSGGDQA